MKKKVVIGIIIVAVIIFIIGIITNYIDTGRVTTGHEPKYCIKIVSQHGSKVTYWGLGYKVIRYVGVSPKEPYENNIGVKMGNWFMKYELSENNEEIKWELENDKEVLDKVDKHIIENELNKVDTLESQYLILTPSKSIKNTNYLQVYNDVTIGNAKNENEKFHIELCFKDNEKNFKLIGKDNLIKEEVVKIFIEYFENNNIPETNDWYKVK